VYRVVQKKSLQIPTLFFLESKKYSAMSLFNNNVMGYGSMARKYGEYAAYYPHYDTFGGSAPPPPPTSLSGTGSGSTHLVQSEAPWPTQDLHHMQHSMSSYYPHHPAFLPSHHAPTARDFREAAAAQVSFDLVFYSNSCFKVKQLLSNF
jgi:hypothetical protein